MKPRLCDCCLGVIKVRNMRHTRSQSRSWADNAIVGCRPLPTTRHLTKPRCSAPAAEFRAQGGGGNVAFVRYRRIGSRGPASSLLYDPDLIRDPLSWLTDWLGKVAVNTSRSRSHHPAPVLLLVRAALPDAAKRRACAALLQAQLSAGVPCRCATLGVASNQCQSITLRVF